MSNNRKFEQPFCLEFIGPEVFKDGPHLVHIHLWSCGTDAMCRPGKSRVKLSPKDRQLGKYGDADWVWPWGAREWRLCE